MDTVTTTSAARARALTDRPEASVVVPVYRNEATLSELLARLDGALADVRREYVFVVDGSPDGSLELLKGECVARPHLRVLDLTRNFGQHAALCAGFDAARGACVLLLDADLQQAPEDLPRFLEAWRAGHDFVSGYRRARTDHPLRRIGSWFLNRLVRTVTGVPLKDWGCPMAAIDRRIVDEVSEQGEQRRFLKPVVARLSRRWCEVEIEGHGRDGGSSYSLLDLLGVALDFVISFSTRPFQRVTGAGIALALLGGGVGAAYLALRLAGLIDAGPRLQASAALAVLLGLQGVILGMLGEYTHRVYRLVQGRPFFEVRGEYTGGGYHGAERRTRGVGASQPTGEDG